MYTIWLWVFLAGVVWTTTHGSFTLQLTPTHARWEEYNQQLPSSFFLQKIVLKSDIDSDIQDLFNELGISVGKQYLKDELKQIFLLIQKNPKYKMLTFLFSEKEKDTWLLECSIEHEWVFLKVVFSGSLIGKEQYRHYYTLEPYERFDKNKHERSCAAIMHVLHEKGYKNARVMDNLRYDPLQKTVTVFLHLDQGPRFTIDHCKVKAGRLKNEKIRILLHKIEKRLNALFGNTYYDYHVIREELQKIKHYCARKGYVTLNSTIHEEKHSHERLVLVIDIQLSSKKLEICGNEQLTTDTIIEHLAAFEPSLVVLPATVIAQEIEKLYRKKGFWQVIVTWYEDEHHSIFTINEGLRAFLQKVTIVGLPVQIDALLHEQFFGGLIANSIDEEKVKEATTALVRHFNHQGYWDFSIVHEEYKIQTNEQYLLELVVQPGEQRILKKIILDSFSELIIDSSFDKFLLACPCPFPAKLLQEQRQFLVQWLMDRGYLYTIPEAELIQEEDGCVLIWHFKGLLKAVTFGKTVICKDTRLPLSILTREIAYSTSQRWNKTARDQTIARLKALEIFDTISLTPLDIFTPEPSKNMLLVCSLADPFELKTRAGFQLVGRHFKFKAITFKWGISALWKNPTYNADQLRFDVDVNRYMREVTASYKIPWLLNNPIKSVFKLYSIRYDQPIIVGSRQTLYQENKEGILASFQKNYRTFNQGITTGLEWMKISCISTRSAQQLSFEPRLVNTYIPYLFGENTLFIDYLDNKIQPRSGGLSVISAKLMIPLKIGHTFYCKVLAEQSFFVPLYRSLIFGFRFRFGHIFNRHFTALVPPERFYLGGAYSIRGYEQDQVPPLVCIYDECDAPRLVPLGGKSMVNINAELRFPLYKSIGGVLFYDGGTLSQDGCALIPPYNFSSSLGFGVRYNSPVGALRFDVGWKIPNKFSDDCSFAWFLTLGQAF